MLALSIVLITLALVFYTVGVWAEHRSGELKWWHVVAFGLGLAADISGTIVMSVIAKSDGPSGLEGNPIMAQAMAVTGLVAVLLMGFHFVWGVVTMVRNKPAEKKAFHKFSTLVWAIWLIPYFTGAIAAMA